MDYIKQLNAFSRISTELALPTTAQTVYMRLFFVNNSVGWAEWFSVTDFRLMFEAGIGSKNTIYAARNVLKQKGFIEFVSKGSTKPVKYRLITLYGSKPSSITEPITEPKGEPIAEPITELKSEHIYKQETKKQETKKKEKHKKAQPEPSGDVHLIIDRLNDVAGTKYKAGTPKTKTLIQARLKEGFSLEDFNRVIDKKCREWSNTEMAKYLRPETLFGTKFESYLNQPEIKEEKRHDRFSARDDGEESIDWGAFDGS